MQKVINTLAVVSFVTSTSIVVAGFCVYKNRDAIKQQIIDSVLGGISVPEVPTEIPSGTSELPVTMPSQPSVNF